MFEDREPIEKAAEIAGDEGICGSLSFTGAGGEVLGSSVIQRGWVSAVVHKEAWGLQRWRGACVDKSLEKESSSRREQWLLLLLLCIRVWELTSWPTEESQKKILKLQTWRPFSNRYVRLPPLAFSAQDDASSRGTCHPGPSRVSCIPDDSTPSHCLFHCPCHFLVPEAVDDRVKHGCEDGVKDGYDIILAWRVIGSR